MGWLLLVVIGIAIFSFYTYSKNREGSIDDGAADTSGSDAQAAATSDVKRVDSDSDTGGPTDAETVRDTGSDRGAPGGSPGVASTNDTGAGEVPEDVRRERANRHGVATDDTLRDIRESIKILNLRGSDATRLGVDESTFESLRQGESGGLDEARREAVLARLHGMLS